MKVKLVSWTNNPIKTIYWAFMNMHNKVPDNLDDINLPDDEVEDFFDMLFKQPHQTVLEFVNTNWLIEGASRAFQQQLTRTRQAGYSIQSLRIVDLGEFAKEGRYTESSVVKNNPEWHKKYADSMAKIQELYRDMINSGMPVEDARGILPLNVHSTITFTINLRSLYHMLELRFCDNTQEEFRNVAVEMRKEVGEKLGKIFTKPMKPICFSLGYCPSPVPCGKYGMEERCKMDVSRWIKG